MKTNTTYTRSFTLENNKTNEQARELDISFSSEFPVQREYGLEILSHEPSAIDFSRLSANAPVLFNHDTGNLCGVIKRAYLQDGKGRAVVKLSKNRNDIWQDVRDGILTNVSVSYVINKYQETKKDGQRAYVVTRWMPTEISFCTVPADPSVGVNRTNNSTTILKENKPMETQDFNKMLALANEHKKYKGPEIMQRVIEQGGGEIELRAAILEEMRKSNGSTINTASFPHEEARKYNLVRAIRSTLEGNFRDTFEHEVHQHVVKTTNREFRGIGIPDNVLFGKRTDMDTTTNAYLVGTETKADMYVDAFRNPPICVRAGAQVINGLVGNVSIPSLTGSGTASWVDENSAASESSLTISQLTMTPHTCSGNMTYTRRLMLQSTPQINALVQNDLAKIVTVAIDSAALCGSGSSYTPEGIVYNSSVNLTSTGGTISYDALLEMEENVATYNGLQGKLAFVVPPSVRKSLRQLFLNTTYGEIPLFQPGREKDMGNIIGYDAYVSNQLAQYSGNDCIIFGDFSQLMIGMWSGIDLIVDQYTESTKGNVVISVFSDIDILIRHPQSFAKIRDLS